MMSIRNNHFLRTCNTFGLAAKNESKSIADSRSKILCLKPVPAVKEQDWSENCSSERAYSDPSLQIPMMLSSPRFEKADEEKSKFRLCFDIEKCFALNDRTRTTNTPKLRLLLNKLRSIVINWAPSALVSMKNCFFYGCFRRLTGAVAVFSDKIYKEPQAQHEVPSCWSVGFKLSAYVSVEYTTGHFVHYIVLWIT